MVKPGTFIKDFSEFCYDGVETKASYVSLNTGVSLFSIKFNNKRTDGGPAIIFIPGLASVIENFRETLIALTRNYEVVYLETREKSSAKAARGDCYTVEDIASDIGAFVNETMAAGRGCYIVGYSLGSTAVAEAFTLFNKKPCGMVLFEPNASFGFPWWVVILSWASQVLYKPLKPFLKWYIRKFRVNTTDDPEMYNINCRILDSADPGRLGKTIRALKPYRTNGLSGKITVPVLVVGASNDKFHSHDEALSFSEMINGSIYYDMVDNRRTHSAEAAEIISDFIGGIETGS